ncbi:MAG: hypothetical protein OEZ13_07250 [Spirochaetia bacterium]|nr:hypothetical protein [Spirochaetia bacterium]
MYKEVKFDINLSKDELYAFLPERETDSQFDFEMKYRALDEQLESLRNELSKAKTVVNLLEEELHEKEKELSEKEKTEEGFLNEAYRLKEELEKRPEVIEKSAEKQAAKAVAIPEMFEEIAEYTEVEEKILEDDGKPGINYN